MNKYVLILGTAFNPSQKQTTSFGQERVKQYVEGLSKIAELAKRLPVFDFLLVDNTINPEWQMPESISAALSQIPNLKTVMFDNNELAAKNKGSGVLAAWKKLASQNTLDGYEYCLYFEPRQLLVDFSFFERFVKQPDNYFKLSVYRLTGNSRPWPIRLFLKLVPIYRKQVNNGLFALFKKIFIHYIEGVSPERLAAKQVSLEDDMYAKLKKIQFTEVKRLGFIWHNAFTAQDVEF